MENSCFDMEVNSLYTGNSFELMSQIKESSIDLIIADGPYAVTSHSWDRVKNIQEYNLELIKEFSRLLKPGASAYLFGKHDAVDFIDYRPYLKLVNRIVWYQPSRLAQGRLNYTDNYDVLFYFAKGKQDKFNLDDIRVPQLVELEHRKRCENVPSVKDGKFGATKFNPKGKNPGNVWGDIKQLTYKSKELLNRKVLHTIQKPEKLMERLIKASSNEGDIVLDPFAGTGTTLKVAAQLGRRFIGIEQNSELISLAHNRINSVCETIFTNFHCNAYSNYKSNYLAN